MKIKITFFFVSLALMVNAANDNYATGARSTGIGNASVCISDVWSNSNNQAGLASLKKMELGAFAERKFLLSQAGLNSAVFALPLKPGVIGLSVNSFGYSQYRDNKYGLCFARKFGDLLSVAMQLDYLSTKIGDIYGSRGAFAAEVGVQAKLMKNLMVGAHIFNPSRTKAAVYNNERIPTIMKAGLSYIFSEKVFFSIETQKDIDHKPVFKAGVEYHMVKEFFIRGGISTNPGQSAFGFGLFLKQLKLDLSASYHPQLGFTPQLSSSYVFNKKK